MVLLLSLLLLLLLLLHAASDVPRASAPGRAADHPEAGAGAVDYVRPARVRAISGKHGALPRVTMSSKVIW